MPRHSGSEPGSGIREPIQDGQLIEETEQICEEAALVGLLVLSQLVAAAKRIRVPSACEAYTSCLAAATPSELPAAIVLYGRDGACFRGADASTCNAACNSLLASLRQAHPGVAACGASPALTDLSVAPTCDPAADWQLGTKLLVTAPTGDPMLTGADENGIWRCPRDDGNPNPPAEIMHRFEPNDTISQAIVYTSNLAIDGTPPPLTGYEICPDRSAPTRADVDVFKFRIGGGSPVKVVVDVKYQVEFGDLDVGLFRENSSPGGPPVRIDQDTSARDDTCLIADSLAPGTYYVVVRGAR